jgi:hypothetical protein
MTMTLEEALAFKLPNGKTLGTATVEELKAELGKDAVPDWAEGLDPSTLTDDDRHRLEAWVFQNRMKAEAATIVLNHLQPEDRGST